MTNMFTNIPEALTSFMDFLHHEVDLPHHNPLVYTQYSSSYYEVASMQFIKLTGKSKKCFCYFYLILDFKSLAEEHKSASYDCKAKELLSKVKTTTITSTAISNMHHCHAYLANICADIEAQFNCDLGHTHSSHVYPGPHLCPAPVFGINVGLLQ